MTSLDTLLQKAPTVLLPDELSYLISAFAPSQPTQHRSKGYLVLASFCQGVRKSSPSKPADVEVDPGTETLAKAFAPLAMAHLGDTQESNIVIGLSFLTALFQVDWECASYIFQADGVVQFVMDSIDLYPTSNDLALQVAHVLGQAAGHKACRAVISGAALSWLEAKSKQTKDTALRAAAAIALVKLSRGASSDNVPTDEPHAFSRDEELAQLMRGIVLSGGDDKSTAADAVEALAYLTVDPVVKEALSSDTPFLTRLFALVPRKKPGVSVEVNSTLLYGVLVVITNICAYPPRLTEEQAQIEKLRKMAKTDKMPGAPSAASSVLDDDEHVKARGRKMITAGVLGALTEAVRSSDSRGVRGTAGKALLGLIEDKENRGKVLQGGGAKALLTIVRQSLPEKASAPLDPTDLIPIQALAKLAITASPVQVFGPNEGAVYDAIRPLSLMLLHPSSLLLQRFEALMALTNLSSQSADCSTRIAKFEGLMNRVELLLLEEHTLVRRAAMELICNLIAGSDDVYERYGGGETVVAGSKSKLQVLLALCDIDDLPTRLAASGALATVSPAPNACKDLLSLERERHRVLPILTELIDPAISSFPESEDAEDNDREPLVGDPGLVHRGVICTRNFLLSITDMKTRQEICGDAEKAGLVRALAGVVQAGQVDETVLNPIGETLKYLIESGSVGNGPGTLKA